MNESSPENVDSSSRDESIVEALVDYCRALDAGQSIDKTALLRRHPNLKDDLSGCFEAFEFIRNAAFSIADSGSSPESKQLPPSRVDLGDFRLMREIGRGGMGIVYEAEQLSLGRTVAVKILPFAALLDDRQLARFKNEARAAAMLKHPNIVSVHSVGCERGVHYYAMELIHGHSLVEVNRMLRDDSGGDVGRESAENIGHRFASDARTKPIAELSTERDSDRSGFYRSAALLGIQAAEALQYAHDRGIIHRDVKPGNLLLDCEGQLYVTDFGLARVQTGDDLTLTGDVVGTPRYMSPEEHDPGVVVDQRTDVYSLGVSLYELITGQPTWQSENRADLTNQILEGQPTRPSDHDRHIPSSLENVLLKAISRDREMRYATAQAFADDLRRFVDGVPVKAKRPTTLLRFSLWAKKNPQVAFLLTLVLTLFMTFAASGAAVAVHFARSNETAEAEVYARTIQLVQQTIDSGNTEEALRLLETTRPAPGETDRRSFEWYHYWDRVQASLPKHILDTNLEGIDALHSPNGQYIVTAGWNGRIVLWDAETGKRIKSSEDCGGILFAVHFLANSKTILAMGQDGQLHMWRFEDNHQTKQDVGIPNGVRHLRMSVWDDRFVAVGYSNRMLMYPESSPGKLLVYDLQKKTTVLTANDFLGKPSVAFSHDGKQLCVGDYSGRIRTWRTSDWQATHTFQAHTGPIYDLASSPAKSHLASSSGVYHSNDGFVAGEIHIWDSQDWNQKQTLHHHNDVVHAVSFSPNGQTLTSGSGDGSIVGWEVETGHSQFHLVGHTELIHRLSFSPSGEELVSASKDNDTKVWSVHQLTSQHSVHLQPVRHSGYVLRLTTDGDTVCSSDTWGQVKVWNARTGSQLFSFEADLPDEIYTTPVPDLTNDRVFVFSGYFPERSQATAKSFELATGRELWSVNLPDGFVAGGAAMHPNGIELMFTSDAYVVGVDKDTGSQTRKIGPLCPHLKSLRFSPDGSRFVCSGGGGTSLDGGMTYVFPADAMSVADVLHLAQTDRDHTPACDFSPDGSLIVTGGKDHIRVWTSDSLHPVRQFEKHPDWVFHVRFSPDGKRVLTGSRDGKLRLWDVQTGIPLMTLHAADDWLWNGEFSDDGSMLFSGDNKINVWSAASLARTADES